MRRVEKDGRMKDSLDQQDDHLNKIDKVAHGIIAWQLSGISLALGVIVRKKG
jgi:hypothetical protein